MLIVEDEPLVAKRLERFAREALGERAGKSAFARSVEEATPLAEQLSASALIFLDLNLFGVDGFDLLEIDIRSPARTIVVSADQSRAVEGFSHGVVDFVAKPFSKERIAQAIERAMTGRDPLAAPIKYLGGAPATPGSGVVFAPVNEVVALHGADDYVEIELSSGKRLLTRKTMIELEAMLGQEFCRIHRSHIVNRSYASEYRAQSGSRYQLILSTGAALPVGRARVDDLKRWLNI